MHLLRDKGAVTILIGWPLWREIYQYTVLLSASFPSRTRCTWFPGSGDSMQLSGPFLIGARVSQFLVCVLGRALEGVFCVVAFGAGRGNGRWLE